MIAGAEVNFKTEAVFNYRDLVDESKGDAIRENMRYAWDSGYLVVIETDLPNLKAVEANLLLKYNAFYHQIRREAKKGDTVLLYESAR